MSLESKVALILISVVCLCITILYTLLFMALWAQRTIIALSLLLVLVGGAALWYWLWMRGKMIEQDIRQTRYCFKEEIPLDEQGEPRYWPAGAHVNPHRQMVVPHPQPKTSPIAAYQQEWEPAERGYYGE